MDLVTVCVVVGLLVAGGVVVYWPLSYKIEALERKLANAEQAEHEAAKLLETERTIDRARDLAPVDELHELGVLRKPNIQDRGAPGGVEL